jgi:hypothetical protein
VPRLAASGSSMPRLGTVFTLQLTNLDPAGMPAVMASASTTR